MTLYLNASYLIFSSVLMTYTFVMLIICVLRIFKILTDPIDMKNPNVAADDNIYCDNVPITPLGPGPAL